MTAARSDNGSNDLLHRRSQQAKTDPTQQGGTGTCCHDRHSTDRDDFYLEDRHALSRLEKNSLIIIRSSEPLPRGN